jgi:hypothetical protein
MNLRNLLVSAAVATAALATAGAASAAAPNTASVTANGSATIIRPISIAVSGALDFGTIVKPNTGGTAGTVSISNAASSPSRTPTGDLVTVGSTFSRPDFSITGEGGQSYNLTIGTLALTSGSNTLNVTLSPSIAAGTNTLGGALGSSQTDHLYIGGSIPVSDTTASGAYSGSFQVTVTYN